jgi:hypothetical protein
MKKQNILDDHYKEGEFDAKSFRRISRAGDIARRDIGADNFNHRSLDVWISDSFDMSIFN